jgi:hypothetical protein
LGREGVGSGGEEGEGGTATGGNVDKWGGGGGRKGIMIIGSLEVGDEVPDGLEVVRGGGGGVGGGVDAPQEVGESAVQGDFLLQLGLSFC